MRKQSPVPKYFWKDFRRQMVVPETLFCLNDGELEFTRLVTRNRYRPTSLFFRFHRRCFPRPTPPKPVPRYWFRTPLEDTTLYGVTEINLRLYQDDFTGMNKIERLTTYHDGDMRSAKYEPWDTRPVQSYSNP